MFRYRWGIGIFCILVAFIGALPAAAQFDRCLENEDEIEYGDEIYGTITGGISPTDLTANNYCFEGQKGDLVLITASVTRGDSGPAGLSVSILSINIPGYMKTGRGLLGESARLSYILPENGAYDISVNGGLFESVGYKLTLINQKASTSKPTPTPRPTATRIPEPTDTPEEKAQDTACAPRSFILIPGYKSEFALEDDQPFTPYCFYGVAGNTYRITADAQSGDLDPLVYVFLARTEETVAFNDNQSLLNKNAQVDFEPEETGVYVVIVARVDLEEGDTEGEYVVEIENRTTREPETCPAAFTIPPEGLTVPQGSDGFYAFCFDGEDDQVATLTARAQRGDLDLDVYITHPDLEPVEDTSSTDDTLELSTRIKRDEPYLILIFDNSLKGGFDLTLEQD